MALRHIASMNILRTYRQTAGVSQVELAKSLGVDQSTVAKIESGKRRPSYDLMVLIEQATNGSVPLASWRNENGAAQ